MNKELMVAASFAASQLYGYRIAARKGNGVWYVVLPPHPQRAVVAVAFEAAGVVVLAEIRQA
jgi:hypothetical protein